MAELVIALDVENENKAVKLASSLKGIVNWFKVGLELFVAHGPSVVKNLKDMGFKVFLDLKFFDIPNTVANGVRSACSLDVDLLTVHCQGGERMCEAALKSGKEYSNGKLLIFGVTVLTSFAGGDLPGLKIPASHYSLELASLAAEWGLPGIVCSGLDVGEIKRLHPDLQCLCPGIRPVNYEKGDQRRVVTPAHAVSAGADFLVVGRPVIAADNPQKAAESILAEMNNI